MPEEYKAEDIKVLEGLEAVRKRPAMYIGDTGFKGFHHLLWEVVDNAIDEALAGYAKNIKVTLKKDGSVVVEDDGRGIPVDIHPQYKISALELVLTKLHAGGKFDSKTYKVSGGLHGVGISVVNALSEFLDVKVKREGKIWHMRFEKGGKKVKDLEVIGETRETGTIIHFKPDNTIFEINKFDEKYVKGRLKELAYLNPYVTITLYNEETQREYVFRFERGIEELVEELSKYKTPLTPVISFSGKKDETFVDIAMRYVEEDVKIIKGYVNNIHTVEGGTHLSGFFNALSRVLRDRISKEKLIKSAVEIDIEDIKEGLIAVVSLKLPQPQFEGQTKTKLGTSIAKQIVYAISVEKLNVYFEENPKVLKIIASRIEKAAQARIAAKKARELVKRKSALETTTLPGKLADCSEKDASKTELFIVEGESAGGSAKLARDRYIQAVLPLKGKIINVEKANMIKVLKNEEIKALIAAIGTGIGDNFDISKLRYGKIIIMTDADVDGAHIRSLLLTFFYRYMRELIEHGHIYVALPPLYKIKAGKEIYYAYSDEEKDEIIDKLKGRSYEIQRYKGLGEMNPDQLWETTMNPQNRYLKKITIEDAMEAEEIFSLLMGEKVEPRKEFIMTHAKELQREELDI